MFLDIPTPEQVTCTCQIPDLTTPDGRPLITPRDADGKCVRCAGAGRLRVSVSIAPGAITHVSYRDHGTSWVHLLGGARVAVLGDRATVAGGLIHTLERVEGERREQQRVAMEAELRRRALAGLPGLGS